MAEKRTDQRYSLRLDRRVLIRQSDGSTIGARASDISRGGIGVLCEYAADRGKEFWIAFLLPLQGVPQQVKVKCRVIFCNFSGAQNAFRIGMQFVEFAGDGERIVKDYLAHRLASAPAYVSV